MPPKRDIKQINAVAQEFKMERLERQAFGDFLESEKEAGYSVSLSGEVQWLYPQPP
jgi:transcriptional antiterminator